MEPLTMLIVGAIYAAKAIDAGIRANKVKKESSSYTPPFSSSSSASSSSVSQPGITVKKDNRMCQPEIKMSNNNKIKSE